MMYSEVLTLQNVSTETLIQLVRTGDPDAFAELMRRYGRLLYRTALSIMKNREDAEDATQEACMKVFMKIHTFQGTAAFSTWMTRVVINVCLMRLRQRRSRPIFSLEEITDGEVACFLPLADSGPTPEQVYSRMESRESLHDAVSRLPSNLRAIAKDQIYGELQMSEMAQKRGISVAAAKSRAYRAKKLITQTLATGAPH